MTDTTLNFLRTYLDRYEIKERLGSGGMASVYRGYDKNLHRQVAIKVLHEHISHEPTFKERFQREARLAASFNHPNIVQIYDFNTLERDGHETSFMVMAHIPGKTLQDLLEETEADGGTLSRARVLQIFQDITSALDYAHQKGMVHRDVKPANIIFDQYDRAVLTDFGIARMAEGSNLTQDGIAVGTPAYMSPEQATGSATDARSDIYALGVILYEMLTGTPPFGNDSGISVLLRHVNEAPPSLAKHGDIDDPMLDSIIFKTLAKRPQDRYQSAAQLIDDLQKAFRGLTPQSMTEDPYYKSPNVTDDGLTQAFVAPVRTGEQAAQRHTPDPTPQVTATTAQSLPRSPLTIFAVGISIIAVVLFIALFSQQNQPTSANTGASQNTDNDTVESMTSTEPLYFSTTFESDDPYLGYWPQGSNSGLIRSIDENAGYRIENRLSGRAVATVFEQGMPYADVSIEMTAVLDAASTTSSGYGIIFRYEDEENYNVFAVDGMGRYSIWVRQNGSWTELRDAGESWTPDEAIARIGSPNTLRIEVYGDTLTGYVNNEMVTMLDDDSIESGGFGVYLAAPPQPDAVALVNISDVSVMEAIAAVDSMTGDEVTVDSMTGEESPEATPENTP